MSAAISNLNGCDFKRRESEKSAVGWIVLSSEIAAGKSSELFGGLLIVWALFSENKIVAVGIDHGKIANAI